MCEFDRQGLQRGRQLVSPLAYCRGVGREAGTRAGSVSDPALRLDVAVQAADSRSGSVRRRLQLDDATAVLVQLPLAYADEGVEPLHGAGMSRIRASSTYPSPSSACSRSEEHTSELQSLMRISYAVLCLK